MMGNCHCDDVTEQKFKLDLVFLLEVAAWRIKNENSEVISSYTTYCLENLLTSFNG